MTAWVGVKQMDVIGKKSVSIHSLTNHQEISYAIAGQLDIAETEAPP